MGIIGLVNMRLVPGRLFHKTGNAFAAGKFGRDIGQADIPVHQQDEQMVEQIGRFADEVVLAGRTRFAGRFHDFFCFLTDLRTDRGNPSLDQSRRVGTFGKRSAPLPEYGFEPLENGRTVIHHPPAFPKVDHTITIYFGTWFPLQWCLTPSFALGTAPALRTVTTKPSVRRRLADGNWARFLVVV